MIPESLFNTAAIAATVIGALGSLLFGVWKVVIKYHTDLCTRLDHIDKCSKRGYSRMKKWEPLLQMLAPNGGKSIHDAISRLEVRGKEIDNQLARNNYLKRKVLSSKASFEADEKGLWIWTNQVLDSLCGVNEGTLLGPAWVRTVTAQQRGPTQQAWFLSVTSGVPFYWDTLIINEETGEEIQITINAQPIHNHKNELVGYFGNISRVV